MLESSAAVTVAGDAATLSFVPASAVDSTALIFICGSGIAAEAYAPLVHPIAGAGFPVFVIKLPYRFAPFESHRLSALARVREVIAAHPAMAHWVASGHSLGGALAARLARTDAGRFSALVLIGTTHPKEEDLSSLQVPVTKVYGSNDGVAPPDRVRANQRLLPPGTKWIEITGGNHSQFGRYGHQLFDGTATISREQQESITRSAILEALRGVSKS
jgi:pimeloyl-ACP methyl ester carboxylesterase